MKHLDETTQREGGLLKSSVTVIDELTEVRGLIDFEEQIARGLMAPDGTLYGPVSVAFDELQYDTEQNRLLFSALRRCMMVLDAFAGTDEQKIKFRGAVETLFGVFTERNVGEQLHGCFRTVPIGRHNRVWERCLRHAESVFASRLA